jgi:hypothetical protein
LKEMKGFRFNNFFEPKAIPISIVCALIYFCYSSVLSFLTAYAKVAAPYRCQNRLA